MILFLDPYARDAAEAVAPVHRAEQAAEAQQLLSDASHYLLGECRTESIERKMEGHGYAVRDARFGEWERGIPLPERDTNHPVVQWVSHDQDSWTWLYDYFSQLVNLGAGNRFLRAKGWFNAEGPRPVHLGRISAVSLHEHPFPVDEALPARHELKKVDKIVWAYRKYYWEKHHKSVQYTGKPPWWWIAFESARGPARLVTEAKDG